MSKPAKAFLCKIYCTKILKYIFEAFSGGVRNDSLIQYL